MQENERALQNVEAFKGFKLMCHDFFSYDPSSEYTEALSQQYLSEDLFQVLHIETQVTVDLGWYGDPSTNKGTFKVQAIQNSLWDEPLITLESKSLSEITRMLNTVLEHIATGNFP